MDTIKTAVVVVLLLAVLYGVYLVLNKPEHAPPPEVTWGADPAELAPPDISFGPPSFDGGEVSVATPVASTGDSFAGEYDETGFGNPITQPSDPTSIPAPPDFNGPSADTDLDVEAGTGGSPSYNSGPYASGSPSSEPPQASPYVAGPSEDVGPSGDSRYGDFSESTPLNEDFQPAVQQGVEAPASTGYAADPNSSAYGQETATVESPSASTGATAASAPTGYASDKFQRAVDDAQAQIDNGNYREALFTLSLLYKQPDLSDVQRDELHNWLDPLAARVIYSREHLLAAAHEVTSDETLSDVANKYRVPWELLRNINGIENPRVLVPGSELKVVPGPFAAEVSLQRRELVLFAGRLYAGRFPVTFGNDPQPLAGSYSVKGKEQGRTFYSRDGQVIAAGSPQNPYGEYWLDLGGDFCIHGSSPNPGDGNSGGCISLSPLDAKDVFEILSPGSKVTIR